MTKPKTIVKLPWKNAKELEDSLKEATGINHVQKTSRKVVKG